MIPSVSVVPICVDICTTRDACLEIIQFTRVDPLHYCLVGWTAESFVLLQIAMLLCYTAATKERRKEYSALPTTCIQLAFLCTERLYHTILQTKSLSGCYVSINLHSQRCTPRYNKLRTLHFRRKFRYDS